MALVTPSPEEVVGASLYLVRSLVLGSIAPEELVSGEGYDPRIDRSLLLSLPLSRAELAERTAPYYEAAHEFFGDEQAERARTAYLDEETVEAPFVLMGLRTNLATEADLEHR